MQSVADIKQAAKVLELARAGVSYRLIARQIGLSIASVAPAAPAIDVIDPRRISKLTSLDGKPHMQSEGHRN